MENRPLLIEFNRGIPKTQKELEILKKDFLSNDITHKDLLKNGENPVLDFNKTKIQSEVVVGKSMRISLDRFGFEEEEIDFEYDLKEIDFSEEFKRALEISFNNLCNKFIDELDKKGIYTSEGLEGYKNVKLKKLNDLILELDNVCDIEEGIKNLIKEFYNKLYDFISNFKSENYQVSKKLNFKLNKNQLIWFFKMMYDKGVISGLHINDVYRLLETNTRYYENGDYVDMKAVIRQAHKLTKGYTSPEKAIKKLSETFDKSFFSSEK
ncbi:hypothetical protein [Winogradskyella vincentii]|uniref:Uncharacterized protein n=1 Tax=Winogradskyella vincentii TaxID=2877122 RepID=A0ABS7XXI0_9FLAO|nr:hypothetical protein [Winogradskyella vincentii]MCA0151725.1 hypothetical protein [Winogradskyella vincentii]